MPPNFLDLREMSARDFYAKLRQTGGTWIFQHIPKTAGSSVTQELDRLLPPYRNIYAEIVPGEQKPRDVLLRRAVERFLADHQTAHFASASGHLRATHIKQLREALPNARVFTILRDPIARLVSDYRYARTPKHPVHEEFAARYPTFRAYAEDETVCNKMWKFMAGPKTERSAERMTVVLSRYVFVGTVENLSADFAFLTALAGYPKVFAARANTTEATADNEVEIDDAFMAELRERNADDVALYDTVTAVLDARRAEMTDFTESRRVFYG